MSGDEPSLFREEATRAHREGSSGSGLVDLPNDAVRGLALPAITSDAGLSLVERLGDLWRGGRPIPQVNQLTAADCGAACLTAILRFHGRAVSLESVREVVGADPQGTSARRLVEGAPRLGLVGRGVKAGSVDDLALVPPGSILHWDFNHYVVLERLDKGSLRIMDPALGRRRVPRSEVGQHFTGVVLIFEPTDWTPPDARPTTLLARIAREVIDERSLWFRILAASATLQLLALGLPVMTSIVVDRILPQRDLSIAGFLAAGLALMVVFQVVLSLVRGHLLITLRTTLDERLTRRFFDHLLRLPYAYFQHRPTGDLLERVRSHGQLREVLTNSAMSGILDGTMVGITAVLLLLASPTLGLAALAVTGLHLGLHLATVRAREEVLAESLAADARTASTEVELLRAIESTKSLGAERQALSRWDRVFVDALNAHLRQGRLEATIGALRGGLSMAAPLLLLAVGAWQTWTGALPLGLMLGLTALAGSFLGPVSNLVGVLSQIQLLSSHLERVADVLDAEPEPSGLPPAPRLTGAVEAVALSFRYSPSLPLAVDSVSLRIEPGSLVAIVGPSGAGKSTLARLLVGLYTPESGEVRFDDRPLTELDLASLRQQVGVVTQSAELFGGTVRDNIALGRPLGLDAVERAGRLAGIAADIEALPMGWEAILADGGSSLSGGQRQRLALARALAAEPPILLLDEATSHLDQPTEAAVQRNLASLECTRIVIAHRLSTIVDADVILVLDHGRLVESGTHGELLASGTLYPKLVEGLPTSR